MLQKILSELWSNDELREYIRKLVSDDLLLCYLDYWPIDDIRLNAYEGSATPPTVKVGGHFNQHTNRDEIYYYVVVGSDWLAETLITQRYRKDENG